MGAGLSDPAPLLWMWQEPWLESAINFPFCELHCLGSLLSSRSGIRTSGKTFWITCCSFNISTCCFIMHFDVMDTTSFLFLKPHEPSSTSLSFLLHLPHLWAFTELKTVRILLWLGFSLKEYYGWFVLLCTLWELSLLSVMRLFHFLIISVFTGVVPLISFKNVSFAFITWLRVWHKRSTFLSISVFHVVSSLNLMTDSF